MAKGKKKAARKCGCGKRLYPNDLAAYSAALYSTRKGALPLSVYRCPVASGWHLTKRR